jgi:hypothetical protein
MKTQKYFCDRFTKKMIKKDSSVKKGIKMFLKITQKQLKTASKEEKPLVLKAIKGVKKGLNIIERNHGRNKLYRDGCKKLFFNPGCKGTIVENDPNLVNNFYTKTNADYLRKQGAKTGCTITPFYL